MRKTELTIYNTPQLANILKQAQELEALYKKGKKDLVEAKQSILNQIEIYKESKVKLKASYIEALTALNNELEKLGGE